MAAIIRLATIEDATQIAAIYAPIVERTATSFEIDPPNSAETARRIEETMQRHPWLVCEVAGELLGYVYAGTYRARPAYQWSVDTSVYIGSRFHRRGVGRALYTAILQALPLQGFFTAYAGVTLPNAASVGLHESLGYAPVGVYRKAGFKFGAWHDVGWWQRPLQSYAAPERAPVPIGEVADSQEFHACLEQGARLLRL